MTDHIKNRLPKNYKYLFALLALIVIFICFFQPFKVTDPLDPRFDPYKFRYGDYVRFNYSEFALDPILPLILKSGMDKVDVEKILVESAHSKKLYIGQAKQQDKYRYCFKPWQTILESIYYMSDQSALYVYVLYHNDKLTEFSINTRLASDCTGDN